MTCVIDARATAGVGVAELGKAHYRRATVRITQAHTQQQEQGQTGALREDVSTPSNGAVKLMQSARQDLSHAKQLMPHDETIQAALLECEASLRKMMGAAKERRKKARGAGKKEKKTEKRGRRQAGEY